MKLAVFTLPGTVIGAVVATKISGILFECILGIILILIVISMLFSHSYKERDAFRKEPHS